MTDLVATFCAYAIMAVALWRYTRRSKSGYVRRQWRRPGWILLRLLSLFVLAYGVFVFFDISAALALPVWRQGSPWCSWRTSQA